MGSPGGRSCRDGARSMIACPRPPPARFSVNTMTSVSGQARVRREPVRTVGSSGPCRRCPHDGSADAIVSLIVFDVARGLDGAAAETVTRPDSRATASGKPQPAGRYHLNANATRAAHGTKRLVSAAARWVVADGQLLTRGTRSFELLGGRQGSRRAMSRRALVRPPLWSPVRSRSLPPPNGCLARSHR